MITYMKAISKAAIAMARVKCFIQTGNTMKATGSMAAGLGQVSIPGRMDEGLRVRYRMVILMGMAFIS